MTFKDKVNIWRRLLAIDPMLAFQIIWRRNTRNSWLKKKYILGNIKQVKFGFDFGLSKMVSFMYTGSYEVDTYITLKNLLKKGDTFIDVGANIGYITALGMGIVEESGEVHSFEPIQRYFKKLSELKELNPTYNLYTVNSAISENAGSATITVNSSDNIGNNSMISDSMQKENQGEEETISTINLSDYLEGNNLNPNLIKIDTEGYELIVLKSLVRYYQENDKGNKPAILCEITPNAYKLMDKSIEDLEDIIESLGLSAFSTTNLENPIDLKQISERVDVVFKTD